jgi:phosphatidylglycerol---prolipoprotein diacylglyceryl transferase
LFPIIARIGPVSIYSYGFFISLAIIVSFFVALRRVKKLGLTSDDLLDLLLYLLIGCIIGAKLLFIMTNDFFFYLNNPIEIIRSGGTGFSFFGIILAGIPISLWYARKKKINYWGLLDVLALSVMIGYAIGRIGCFLNGCCYGVPVNPYLFSSFLACQFVPHDYARYPTQIFISFGAFISFFILRIVDKRKAFYGATFASFILLYALITLAVDFYRDMARFAPFNLTMSQYLAIFLVPVALGLLVFFSKTQTILIQEGHEKIGIGDQIDQSSFSEESNEAYLE